MSDHCLSRPFKSTTTMRSCVIHLFFLLLISGSVVSADTKTSPLRKPSLVRKVEEQALAVVGVNPGRQPPSQQALVRIGCLLAANSGYLNGLSLGGLLGKKQVTAAVTGAWTTSALAMGKGDYSLFASQVSIILGYFGGSCINGLMNPKGIDWNMKPGAPLIVAAALVFLGALDYPATDRFLLLLAVANGLQNSFTSMLISGNVLRTGHFSGMTSDMGTFVGQILRGNDQNVWKFRIFGLLALSFFTGGLISVYAGNNLTEVAFLVSVCLYLGLWSFLTFFQKPFATESATMASKEL